MACLNRQANVEGLVAVILRWRFLRPQFSYGQSSLAAPEEVGRRKNARSPDPSNKAADSSTMSQEEIATDICSIYWG